MAGSIKGLSAVAGVDLGPGPLSRHSNQMVTLLVATVGLLSWACAGNSASKQSAGTISETLEKSFPLVIKRLTLWPETLSGQPGSGGGLVELSVVQAPKGTAFLSIGFSSQCLSQGTQPSLLAPDRAVQELKRLANINGDCTSLPAHYEATFHVSEKVKSFVLQIGDQRAPIDVSGLKKRAPANPR